MHIVAVDGSRTGLLFIQRLLEEHGDTVALFTNGREALEYFRTNDTVDVLITSMEVPAVSGMELVWEARLMADEGRPFYVVAMSSNTDPQVMASILDAGADDFITKPPSQHELSARLRVARRTTSMQKKLIELATLDPLSGLLNRRAFWNQTDQAIAALPKGAPVSLVLFDIDHFKRINDIFGHDSGDNVIRAVGGLKKPPGTILARIGGEEFAVMMAGSSLEEAMAAAEALRQQVASLAVPGLREDEPIRFTASFGVATATERPDRDELYRSADSALYHAKNSGRNRVASLRQVVTAPVQKVG